MKKEEKDERCPNCGYCKHCGQSKPVEQQYRPYWIWQEWRTYPATQTPTIYWYRPTSFGTTDATVYVRQDTPC